MSNTRTFIDTHSKGDSGADDTFIAFHEVCLDLLAGFVGHTRMVDHGLQAMLTQFASHFFGLLLKGDIDDGRASPRLE